MIYLGGWPVVKSQNWNEFSWTYQKFVQTAELLGLPQNYLFEFKLIQDLQNKTRSILLVKFLCFILFVIALKFIKEILNLDVYLYKCRLINQY